MGRDALEVKKCRDCGIVKHKSEFYTRQRTRKVYLSPDCKPCACKRSSALVSLLPTEERLFKSCQARAKHKGMDFNITLEDVIIPHVCPILGLILKDNHPHRASYSPSLDRVNSDLGYVKGNVQIVSWRANRLKSDMSFKEVEKLYFYFKHHLNEVTTKLTEDETKGIYFYLKKLLTKGKNNDSVSL